eukprot:gene4384-biopygen11316
MSSAFFDTTGLGWVRAAQNTNIPKSITGRKTPYGAALAARRRRLHPAAAQDGEEAAVELRVDLELGALLVGDLLGDAPVEVGEPPLPPVRAPAHGAEPRRHRPVVALTRRSARHASLYSEVSRPLPLTVMTGCRARWGRSRRRRRRRGSRTAPSPRRPSPRPPPPWITHLNLGAELVKDLVAHLVKTR